jgi:hypothetical protein
VKAQANLCADAGFRARIDEHRGRCEERRADEERGVGAMIDRNELLEAALDSLPE